VYFRIRIMTSRKKILPISSSSKKETRQAVWKSVLVSWFVGSVFGPEDGISTFFRNLVDIWPDYIARRLRK
jgi:hypothetical protein